MWFFPASQQLHLFIPVFWWFSKDYMYTCWIIFPSSLCIMIWSCLGNAVHLSLPLLKKIAKPSLLLTIPDIFISYNRKFLFFFSITASLGQGLAGIGKKKKKKFPFYIQVYSQEHINDFLMNGWAIASVQCGDTLLSISYPSLKENLMIIDSHLFIYNH